MDWQALAVVVIAGAFGVFGTWLGVRAKRTSDEIERKANREASLLEGYDEWATHLANRLKDLERQLDECTRERLDLRGELIMISAERDHLVAQLARYRRGLDEPGGPAT